MVKEILIYKYVIEDMEMTKETWHLEPWQTTMQVLKQRLWELENAEWITNNHKEIMAKQKRECKCNCN